MPQSILLLSSQYLCCTWTEPRAIPVWLLWAVASPETVIQEGPWRVWWKWFVVSFTLFFTQILKTLTNMWKLSRSKTNTRDEPNTVGGMKKKQKNPKL